MPWATSRSVNAGLYYYFKQTLDVLTEILASKKKRYREVYIARYSSRQKQTNNRASH